MKVSVGESVTTSLFSRKYPANLLIGTVYKVKEDPGSHFHKIYIKPASDFFKFSQLFVLNYIPDPAEVELIEETDKKIMMMESRKK